MNCDSVAVWLYGSNARGDPDSRSDLDVLAVSDLRMGEREIARMAHSGRTQLSISRYNWAEVNGMASYGSLFLHHVHLEGQCLFEGPAATGRLSRILGSLVPYGRAESDVAAFRTALHDVRSSLAEGGSIQFELSVLGTVLRHACILGCYITGVPAFGRIEPVQRIVELWNLDAGIAHTFPQLYEYRLWADRRARKPEQASLRRAYSWCESVGRVLNELEARANDHQRGVSQTNSLGQRGGQQA